MLLHPFIGAEDVECLGLKGELMSRRKYSFAAWKEHALGEFCLWSGESRIFNRYLETSKNCNNLKQKKFVCRM